MDKRMRWILAYLAAVLPIIMVFGTMGVIQYRSEKSFYDHSAKVMAFVVKSVHVFVYSGMIISFCVMIACAMRESKTKMEKAQSENVGNSKDV